jgi:hypothetical protein
MAELDDDYGDFDDYDDDEYYEDDEPPPVKPAAKAVVSKPPPKPAQAKPPASAATPRTPSVGGTPSPAMKSVAKSSPKKAAKTGTSPKIRDSTWSSVDDISALNLDDSAHPPQSRRLSKDKEREAEREEEVNAFMVSDVDDKKPHMSIVVIGTYPPTFLKQPQATSTRARAL